MKPPGRASATSGRQEHRSPATTDSNTGDASSGRSPAGGTGCVGDVMVVHSRPIPGPDLWDDVIQQLFATGLAMRTTQRRCSGEPVVSARMTEHMNDLQHLIRQIRSSALAPETHSQCVRRPATRQLPAPEDGPP